MKKVFSLILLFVALTAWPQTTPSAVRRVASSATVFTSPLPSGNILVDVGTNKAYQIIRSVAGTNSLSTLAANIDYIELLGLPFAYNSGGILYSGASSVSLMSGNSAAGRVLLSGAAAAPTWSANALGTGAYATIADYLPLAGGTMSGHIKINDDVHLYMGTGVSGKFDMYHSGTNFYMFGKTGHMFIGGYTASGNDVYLNTTDGTTFYGKTFTSTLAQTDSSNALATTRFARTAARSIIPSQTSQNGKYLTTNGTSLSWGTVSGGWSDGDKGDITVGGSGTTLTIEAGAVTEAKMTLADNTTNDFSTSKHGWVPKGTNVGKYLADDCTWKAISGGAGGTVTSISSGNGMNFTSPITATGTITLGTPSDITASTTNSVSGTTHSHALAAVTVAKGGTGLTSVGIGSVLACNSTNVLEEVNFYAAGTKVLSNTYGTISWANASGFDGGTVANDVTIANGKYLKFGSNPNFTIFTDLATKYIEFNSPVSQPLFTFFLENTTRVIEADLRSGASPRYMYFGSSGHSIMFDITNSLATIDDPLRVTGYLETPEQSSPATPASGYGRVYFNTSGSLCYKNDAGADRVLSYSEAAPGPSPKPTMPQPEYHGFNDQVLTLEYSPDLKQYRTAMLIYEDGKAVGIKRGEWKRRKLFNR